MNPCWTAACSALCWFAADTAPQEREDPSELVAALLEDWRWAHFSREQGLPNRRALAVVEAAGTPWVNTRSGIAWFDGWRWQAVSGAAGLPEQAALSLDGDAQGFVVAAFPGAVFRGRRDDFTRLELPAGLQVAGAACLAGGRVLVVGSADGAARAYVWQDGRLAAAAAPPSPLAGSPHGVFHAAAGKAWINCKDGFYEWHADGWRLKIARGEQDSVGAGFVIENLQGEGLASFDPPSQQMGLWEWSGEDAPRRTEVSGFVRAAALSDRGERIVLISSEVLVGNRDERLALAHALPRELQNANFLAFRANGDLWVCGDNGVYLLRRGPLRWSTWQDSSAPPARRIHEICAGSDEVLWLATERGLRGMNKSGAWLAVPPGPPAAVLEATGVAEDQQGRVWVGSGSSYAGLLVLDGASWRHVTSDARGRPIGLVHKIRRDRRGRLWFLGLTDGLDNRLGKNGFVLTLEGAELRPWPPAQTLSKRRYFDFCEGADGCYWFATSAGACRYDGVSWTGLPPPPLLDAWPYGVYADSAGGAWYAQRWAGLIHYERSDASWLAHDFPEIQAWSVQGGAGGILWCTTPSGLACLRDGEWWSFQDGGGAALQNSWPLLAGEDRIYAGSLGGGLTALQFAEFDTPAPQVEIRSASGTTGESTWITWSAHSWWGELPAEQILTRHRFDQGEWSPWSTVRRVELVGLKPGDHSLEVQAKGLFAKTAAPALLEFRLPPPLLRDPLFLGPVAGLSLALGGLSAAFTLRKLRDRRRLREGERAYRRLMEEASDAILIFDQRGRCRLSNGAAQRLYGRAGPDLGGVFLDDLLRCTASPLLPRLQAGEEILEEIVSLTADNRQSYTEVSVKRLEDERLQVIARDLTERRRLEETRRQLDQQLAAAQRAESLSLLAKGAAHDFNNLLMIIDGRLDEAFDLLDGDAPARAELEGLREAVQRAGELTDQLLAYAGREMVQTVEIDINELLLGTHSLLAASAGKRMKIHYLLGEALPRLRADPVQIRQVILNMAFNAAEAQQGRPGRLVIRTARAPGETAARETRLLLEFQDSGPGIPPEIRPRIFEPFFSTKPGNRGLGLAAAHGIVQSHGGRIEVESAPGAGAIFRVYFPACPDRTAAGAPAAAEHGRPALAP